MVMGFTVVIPVAAKTAYVFKVGYVEMSMLIIHIII